VGLGTEEDLFDAVQWAIDNGVADPKRIAAMGGSMGGYATLRALEMKPDLFAAASMHFGPGDLATSFRSSRVTGRTSPTVGAAARVMLITMKSGIAPFRRSTTPTKFARRFSLLREKTIRV
jgi:dienelactone hydrolase